MNYAEIEQRIFQWAESRQDIRAVFVIGSRGQDNVDSVRNGSDLDVLVVSSKPELYRFEANDWCRQIAPMILVQKQVDAHMVFPSSNDYYAVFSPDLDVDFSFVSLKDLRWEIAQGRVLLNFPKIYPDIFAQRLRAEASAFHLGFRALIDHDTLARELKNTMCQIQWVSTLPSAQIFLRAVDEFLILTFKAYKKAESDKLFHAKWICDVTLKIQIIRMAEWHVRSLGTQDKAIRRRDLAIDEWADKQVKEEMTKISSGFEAKEIYNALYASLNLFYWMIVETAKNLGYQDDLVAAIDSIEWLREKLESSL